MKHIVVSNFILCVAFLIVWFNVCAGTKNVYSAQDPGDTSDDDTKLSEDDESFELPENETMNSTICTRRSSNSSVHEIRLAKPRQFPFVASVMSANNDHLCSGSVISIGMILTTAHCTLKPVSHVLLNTTKDKKDDTAVRLHIRRTERFPTFDPNSSVLKNVGILYVEKHNGSVASKIKLSNFTTNERKIHEIEAIGFGLNTEADKLKEMQYVGLELRPSPAQYSDMVYAYIDCIDTHVKTCFKDTGGPAIVNNELIGVITYGQDECTEAMTSTYEINKRMAEIIPIFTFKAWLDDKIAQNELQNAEKLSVYPAIPMRRFAVVTNTTKPTNTTTTMTTTTNKTATTSETTTTTRPTERTHDENKQPNERATLRQSAASALQSSRLPILALIAIIIIF